MKPAILTVGAANAERLIRAAHLSVGRKQVVPPALLTAGGSAVNHACRLLAAGYQALSLIPLGKDDIGQLVCRTIFDAAKTGNLSEPETAFLKKWLDAVAQPDRTTGYTTIIVEQDGRRSIFSETGSSSERFGETCAGMLSSIEPETVCAVIIGHVHADAEPRADIPYGRKGAITSSIIAHFVDNTPIVANIGRSQYRLGPSRWLEELAKVDIVQFAYDEAKEFASLEDRQSPNLAEIVEWFQSNGITAVLTFDRFGALGTVPNQDRVVLAWPYDLGAKMVDGTGAGDAMAAGLAAHMATHGPARHWTIENLRDAMHTGRSWAGYACTELGGAANCPSKSQLEEFAKEASTFREVEIIRRSDADSFLWLLDRAFSSD